MVVAVAVVRVVEVTLDQIIGVIAVRHAGMSARGAVDVVGRVAGAAVVRRALRRVGRVDGDRVLIDVIAVDVMQVPIVEVVDVAGVLDREMAAAGAVNMVVALVDGVRHGVSWLGGAPGQFDGWWRDGPEVVARQCVLERNRRDVGE
jgi:hypothetical protein